MCFVLVNLNRLRKSQIKIQNRPIEYDVLMTVNTESVPLLDSATIKTVLSYQ